MSQPSTTESKGGGVRWKLWVAFVLVALALVVIFQNTADARFEVLFWTVTAPLWVLLLGTFVAGVLAGWLAKTRRTSRARARA